MLRPDCMAHKNLLVDDDFEFPYSILIHFRLSPLGTVCSTSAGKSLVTCAVKSFLGKTCSSQVIANEAAGPSWQIIEPCMSEDLSVSSSGERSDDVTILLFRQVIARKIWALRETLLLGSIAQYLGLLKSHYKP